MEYLKLYQWKEWNIYGDKKKYPYSARIGNSKDVDYVVLFRTQDDMIAFDNWDTPGLKYQHLVDAGRNLYNRVMKQLDNQDVDIIVP